MVEEMRPDFHVVSLQYKIEHGENIIFNDPPPVEFETVEASFQLKDGVLSCQPKKHYGTEGEARSAIEPILRAWEMDAIIKANLHGLKFKFSKAEIIDRSPAIRGQQRIVVGSIGMNAILGTPTVQVGWAKYPDPPFTFRVTPDVESLWLRFQGHVGGREPLLSMAYFCLTVLEARAGGRAAAAKTFGIDKSVLDRLGELTSKRGDRLTARKVKDTAPMIPLTGVEKTWVLAVIKALILRIGDTRDIATLPKIKMDNLPKL